MAKRILVLMTSPRKHGNTNALCDAFIAGAEKAGHSVTKISTSDGSIHPCKACNYCATHDGVCVQKDGMQAVYEAMEKADVVVLSSPLYFYSISAQLKIIIDRMYAMGVTSDFAYSPKECALLMTCMESDPQIFIQPMQYYRTLLERAFPWTDRGTVLAAGLGGEPDSINGHPALQEAMDLGAQI